VASATANDNYEYVGGNNICETGTENIQDLSQRVNSHVECKALCDSSPDCVAISILVNNFCQVFSKFCENPFGKGTHVAAHYKRLKRPQSNPTTVTLDDSPVTTAAERTTLTPTITTLTTIPRAADADSGVTGDTAITMAGTHSFRTVVNTGISNTATTHSTSATVGAADDMFSMADGLDLEDDTLWLILIFVGVVIIFFVLSGLAYAVIRRRCIKKKDGDPASLKKKDQNPHKVIKMPTIPKIEYEVVEMVTDNMSATSTTLTERDKEILRSTMPKIPNMQYEVAEILRSTMPKIPNMQYEVAETVADDMSTTSTVLTERDREILRYYGVNSTDDSQYTMSTCDDEYVS